MNKAIPKINTQLRSHTILVPEVYREATGVLINGKRIKSLVFSTDVAVIANCNADAVIAVYPFTPTIQITEAIISVAQRPVFVGVGGGTTAGKRVESIALDAELHGATAVVLNAPTTTEFVQNLADDIDIPVVLTIVSLNEDLEKREFWKKKYSDIILDLRSKYKNALFIVITTILCHDKGWDDALDEMVESINDKKIVRFKFKRNGVGTPGHIRIPEAEEMSKELTEFIESFGEEIWK